MEVPGAEIEATQDLKLISLLSYTTSYVQLLPLQADGKGCQGSGIRQMIPKPVAQLAHHFADFQTVTKAAN